MKEYIPVFKAADLYELKKAHHLEKASLVKCSIGYDGGIYLLFSAKIPERIQGMFVDTQANTEYKALCLWMDWEDGSLLGVEALDFGFQGMNFHFIQPIGNLILLLGARTRQYKDGTRDQNAVFLTRRGQTIDSKCMEDGIDSCIVLEDGRIITSYFDEGIFGDVGLDSPGLSGLAVWNQEGQVIWKNTKYPIWDCYAINIDEQNHLWFYYYNDFNLVKTDFHKDCVWKPEIAGSSAFLIKKSHTGIIMDGGYHEPGKLKLVPLQGQQLGTISDVEFAYENQPVTPDRYCFRSSKAVMVDKENQIFCIDII